VRSVVDSPSVDVWVGMCCVTVTRDRMDTLRDPSLSHTHDDAFRRLSEVIKKYTSIFIQLQYSCIKRLRIKADEDSANEDDDHI
jgi:hypothetical protein